VRNLFFLPAQITHLLVYSTAEIIKNLFFFFGGKFTRFFIKLFFFIKISPIFLIPLFFLFFFSFFFFGGKFTRFYKKIIFFFIIFYFLCSVYANTFFTFFFIKIFSFFFFGGKFTLFLHFFLKNDFFLVLKNSEKKIKKK
jgi:hypothetical protein